MSNRRPATPNSITALIVAAILVIVAATGCGQTAGVAIAQSSLPRNTSPNVTDAALAELSAGNTAFALDLYQAIRGADGNLFYSPYSLSIALAMTCAGARGETERQMAETLHYSLPQDQLHPAFNALDLSLNQQRGGDENFTLKTANSVWAQADYDFLPEYLDALAENYGAGLRLVDYKDEGARENSRQAINEWVGEQTEGKIQDLLAKGILTEMTRLVLANAIYFKAEWETPFLNGTEDREFTLLNGDTVTVPMMGRRAETRHAEGDGYQAVEILYKGDRIRMVIVLPAPGQFEAFEQSLDSARLDEILQSLTPKDVKLFMPKFQYAATLNLGETLSAMGMPDAFTPFVADFSGMDGTHDLYLSHVVHKAFVAVDEMGTEAAAASGIVAEIVSMPLYVTLDHPFIFVIRDAETGAILFVGRVVNPTP
jgi:serpin B